MYSSLVAAQEQSFICQGEQIATIPYSAGNNGAAEIKPAEGSLNNQTWIFNEDGLALIGSTQLLLGISYCDFNDAGLPNCKALSNYFNIFNNNTISIINWLPNVFIFMDSCIYKMASC